MDGFTVDHTRVTAPAVRVAKTMKTLHGDTITVFDLRFCRPNLEVMPERGIHTLEHLFAGLMRNHLNGEGIEIVDISPMRVHPLSRPAAVFNLRSPKGDHKPHPAVSNSRIAQMAGKTAGLSGGVPGGRA